MIMMMKGGNENYDNDDVGIDMVKGVVEVKINKKR